MKPIFLIGYMGSGKTTLGRALSKATGLDFIDTDLFIERRFHCSTRQIFEQRGEEAYRIIERNTIRELAEFENVIISCGGGTPCFFDNMEVMNNHGITIFLDTTVKALYRRLSIPSARAKRPLIAAMTDEELESFIVTALEKRRPKYSQAQITYCADRLESPSQINESVEAVRKLLNL